MQALALEQRIMSELAPAPPHSEISPGQPEDMEEEVAPAQHAARLASGTPPALHPVQRLLPRPRPQLRPPPTRAQAALRWLQASRSDTTAAAGGGSAERALRAVVMRRLLQMVATGSTLLNLDLSIPWTATDVPCIMACIQYAS